MTMRDRLIVVLIASVLVVSGCTTKLTRQTFESATPPISVAWQKADLTVPKWDSQLLMALGGFVTIAVGEYMREQNSKKWRKGIMIPDIGSEVASRFTKSWKENGNAPKMVLLKNPVESNHEFPGASINFTFKEYFIGMDDWLLANCIMTMKDNSGKIIHKSKKSFNGFSLDRKRHSHEEFKADNAKLLVEEIQAASQYLADEFVKEILFELSK